MASTMAFDLLRRDAVSDIESIPSTFSSWDSCMSKAYCKWPVIVGIVIGALILLSLITCLARCLCCGMECCCSCLSCLRCCDCFTPRSRRNKGSRYRDDYQQMAPTPYSGYQPTPAPIMYQPAAPQFATFDANRKVNDDSLPAMPSWETAATRHVEDYPRRPASDDVEMGHLANTTETQALISGGGPQSYAQNAAYPSAAPPAFASHAYNSDLGAQRQSPSADYRGTGARGNTPAPSYHTYPEEQEGNYAAESDRFATSAISPSPYAYHNNQHQSSNYTHQVDHYISPASTQYEASNYLDHGYGNTSAEDYAYRSSRPTPAMNQPPSFMQVGRRPVKGSAREI